MVKRSEIHLLNRVLSPLAAFAAVFLVYQGVAEPYVPAPGVPSGGTGVLVLSVAVAALAYAGAARVETRSYRAAGDMTGVAAGQVDGTVGSIAGSQSPTDEATVVHEENGLTLDCEALDSGVEAVTAVADAVDSATEG